MIINHLSKIIYKNTEKNQYSFQPFEVDETYTFQPFRVDGKHTFQAISGLRSTLFNPSDRRDLHLSTHVD